MDQASVPQILVGKAVTTESSGNVYLLPKYGNRHGLVAGATGTGKTVTLMTLAEGFSRIGVPVFLADVKGDVSGLAMPGAMNDRLQQRISQMGIADYRNEAAPVVFWDLWGKLGHPVRTTVSEMGPTLLGRILELNDTQGGVLDILFKLNEAGITIIMIEHIMHAVMRFSERVVCLDAGRKIADGDPQDVIATPEVRKAYLGE